MPAFRHSLALGIDTTGDWCCVALVDAATILAMGTQNIGRGHAELLSDMVQSVMETASIKPADIDKLSVCVGPGSFTGLRVGLSFAKGFALPHNIPIVGLSALEIWAANADPDLNKTILAVADVRRGQLLSQTFKNGQATNEAKLSSADERIGLPKVLVGGGAGLLGANDGSTYVCPAILAWLGLAVTPETHPAEPLYHRPPDAKLPGKKTLA